MAQAVAVTIRDVRGPEELRACQDLQRRAWGTTEDGYVLPVATMAGAQKVGGVILGAFDGPNLIGFAFAFLGKLNNRLVLYSQLTGVHPAHQSTGVGRLLKFEQRRRATEMGLEAVVWAFDPLQASNAAFNLGVLGAICRTYEVDLYGSRSDALNAGLATDRLFAEWPTAGPPQARPDVKVETTSIEIPPDINTLKTHGPAGSAHDWQLAVRHAFQAAFAAGFVAVGFSRADRDHPRYLLERTT